jgi:branched-chain amino acid transport system permease protein
MPSFFTAASFRNAILNLAVALIFLAPLVLTDFRAFQATQILIYAIAILGLNLLTGFNGQISLGHGAFFAIGAYTTAILMDQASAPYWTTIPAAGLVCFLVGFLFGRPALRLDGIYLALATFALAIAVPQFLKYPGLEKWTGGVQGVVLSKPNAPFGLPLGQDKWLYIYVLLHVIVLFACAKSLLHGRVGRAIRAIRDQPLAAETAGIDIALYKTSVFGISAMYTGIAGALSAIVIQFVAPDSFTMFLSIFLMVGAVVGGVATIWGAFFGAIFIMVMPSLTADISKAAPGVIYAAVLFIFMFRLPAGVWGSIARLGSARTPSARAGQS